MSLLLPYHDRNEASARVENVEEKPLSLNQRFQKPQDCCFPRPTCSFPKLLLRKSTSLHHNACHLRRVVVQLFPRSQGKHMSIPPIWMDHHHHQTDSNHISQASFHHRWVQNRRDPSRSSNDPNLRSWGPDSYAKWHLAWPWTTTFCKQMIGSWSIIFFPIKPCNFQCDELWSLQKHVATKIKLDQGTGGLCRDGGFTLQDPFQGHLWGRVWWKHEAYTASFKLDVIFHSETVTSWRVQRRCFEATAYAWTALFPWASPILAHNGSFANLPLDKGE